MSSPIRVTPALIALVFVITFFVTASDAAGKVIILATTTSTQDSGLLDELMPVFEKKTGYVVKTIAVGSGQAMTMGKKGEADVLLVHSPDAEKKFMEEGSGINRRAVMHNDFVIAGPAGDPAGVKKAKRTVDAMKRIAASESLFVSRGDNSGTHMKEKNLWKEAGLSPAGAKWYQETGLGMGQTLSVASEKGGYVLADRGTWLAMKNNLSLAILAEGDAPLRNPYHVIEVHPVKWPRVNNDGARIFSDFIVSKQGQEIIRSFGIAKYGSPLFFPNAVK